MSRLSQADYLAAARRLKHSRERHDPSFVQLTPTDQLNLIVYFGLDTELTPTSATKYRRRAATSDVSLPQRAGKAFRRFESNIQDTKTTVHGVVQLNEALLIEALTSALED